MKVDLSRFSALLSAHNVKDTENARIIDSLHHMQMGNATSRDEDSVQVKVDMNVWEQGYTCDVRQLWHVDKGEISNSRAGLLSSQNLHR